MEENTPLEISLSTETLHYHLEDIQQARSNNTRLKAVKDSVADDFTLIERHRSDLLTILDNKVDAIFKRMLKKAQ